MLTVWLSRYVVLMKVYFMIVKSPSYFEVSQAQGGGGGGHCAPSRISIFFWPIAMKFGTDLKQVMI